jgi:flagellin-like protein
LTKNAYKSRKGISPILATLLLIVIAVAAIVVTYAWIMTYMGNAGQQAGVMLYKANVRFYAYDNGTKSIDIDMGNKGTSDTQILQVYIGTSSSNMINQTTTPPLPVPVTSGASPARITVDYDWTAGLTYYFRIVPRYGQQIDWSEKAQVL